MNQPKRNRARSVTIIALLTAVLTLGLLWGGLAVFFNEPTATCGGRQMKPGDLCETVPSGRTQTYSEVLAADQSAGPQIGVVLIVVSFAIAAVGARVSYLTWQGPWLPPSSGSANSDG